MRKEYRNFNNVGKVSSALLLLLTFFAINPVITSAYAEELGEQVDFKRSSDEAVDEDDSDSIASFDAITSTVSISFSPSAGSASISPTSSAGASAQIKVLATVSVQNSGGYSVYVKGNSQNLVGQSNSNNTIPGVTGSVTYANLPVNTWGYYAAEGAAISDSATYKVISTSGNGDKITENTGKSITSDTKTIALGFVARINDTKPADTYKNTVTMSVISSPIQVAIDFGIETMQEMTSAICTNAKDNDKDGQISGQLRDTRDGKYYWVSKLADNKCWMTQNLDLDLDASTTPLTSTTSDVSTNWTPGDDGKNPAYTETTASSATIYNDATGQRSWSLGNYRITNPTASSSCDSKKASAADCPEQFTEYTTPTSANGDANAHYILGNHYQWNAATAGTGGTIASGQASSSICPKNWRLPTGNGGEFQALINAGAIGSDVTKLTSSPYYFVRGSTVDQNTSSLFNLAGNNGYYWSSTPDSDGIYAYNLGFYGTSGISPSSSGVRQTGRPLRCLAR